MRFRSDCGKLHGAVVRRATENCLGESGKGYFLPEELRVGLQLVDIVQVALEDIIRVEISSVEGKEEIP